MQRVAESTPSVRSVYFKKKIYYFLSVYDKVDELIYFMENNLPKFVRILKISELV